jgi:hypothetical protein
MNFKNVRVRPEHFSGRLASAFRARTRRRPPDFAPSSETPDSASSFRLREAMSDKPGGYVGQAVLESGESEWSGVGLVDVSGRFCPAGTCRTFAAKRLYKAVQGFSPGSGG